MNLLPTSVGTRPRLACEIRPEGLVAARGESPSGLLTSVARAELPPGAVLPGLKTGNLPGRAAVVAGLRRVFDQLSSAGGDRSRYVTVIVPDAAVRVLLVDFDALPSKAAEALPIVRFRLKKLLPFDVEHALVSYQIMSTERTLLRVLAVAIPLEVLAEYEGVVAEAGMQPGVVLPSTLAAVAGLDAALPAALLLNSTPTAMTTAILRAGVLLLHRTVELYPAESSEQVPVLPSASIATGAAETPRAETEAALLTGRAQARFQALDGPDAAVAVLNTAPDLDNRGRDLAESVSVAAAYFEDTLGTPPGLLLTAGSTAAHDLRRSLLAHGFQGLDVRELLGVDGFGPGASTATVPHGLLAGVRGALRS